MNAHRDEPELPVGEQSSPLLAVVGPGAVGGLLTAMLVRNDEDVVVVARADTAEQIRRLGLTVHSPLLGEWTSLPAISEEVPADSRVVLSVKAHALVPALNLLRAAPPREVLTVLNGIGHVGTLRRELPHTQVIPATITVEAARQAPTVIEHRSPFIRLTVPDSALTGPTVTSLRRAGVEVIAGGGEDEVLWRKFRFLAPMALLTTFHQASLGDALRRDPGLTAAIVAEVAATATGAGLATSADELTGILNGLPTMMRSSLQIDVAAGGPSELEALGGDLQDAASRASVQTPACALLVEALRRRTAA